MNERGLPITLIILTQYQGTDLSLLELSAAAGPGVDLRLRGRPGPRRAGLRDVSSFLQGGRREGGREERKRETERDQRCWSDSRRNQGETYIGYRSNCIRYEQAVSHDKSGGCSMTAELWMLECTTQSRQVDVCVRACVCARACVLVICGRVWKRVTLEWLGMPLLTTVFRILRCWFFEKVRGAGLGWWRRRTPETSRIPWSTNRKLCLQQLHFNQQRADAMHIYDRICKIQIICSKMSRFRPKWIKNTTKYFSIDFQLKTWFRGLVTLWREDATWST